MSAQVPFEYAVIRVVPRVERGEFVNVGVLVYCQARSFLDAAISVNGEKLRALDDNADVAEITQSVEAYVGSYRAATRDDHRELGERFRWLTAPRSTVVQPGPVHTGLTDDPAAELVRLTKLLVSS